MSKNPVVSLVIGKGEVGNALYKVLLNRVTAITEITDIKDKSFDRMIKNEYRAIHICFSFSDSFISSVVNYAKSTECKIVIIHSTIPVGTTTLIKKKLKSIEGIIVTHSPVRGQHPNLEESLTTFVKYIGADIEKEYLFTSRELAGIQCKWAGSTETTELAKMLSTSYYGVIIAWHREMKRICDKSGVNFDEAVTQFNETYNRGYQLLKPNVIRPVLTPPTGKIGGHCVTQNARLLEKQFPSVFLSLIE